MLNLHQLFPPGTELSLTPENLALIDPVIADSLLKLSASNQRVLCMGLDEQLIKMVRSNPLCPTEAAEVRRMVEPMTTPDMALFCSILLYINGCWERKLFALAASLHKVEGLAWVAKLLPTKAYAQVFEPSYFDEKRQFLLDRLKHTSKGTRHWLRFCFELRVGYVIVQCVWQACGGVIQRLVLEMAPQLLRKILGL